MNATSGSYATFQLFRFDGIGNRLAALKDMGLRSLRKDGTPPVFSRHLGSGAGSGFSLWPDWSTYGYFAVWSDQNLARKHLDGRHFQLPWASYAAERLGVLLKCTQVHGKWEGRNPLAAMESNSEAPIAVLTRARVRVSRLHRFWKHVPGASRAIEQAKGCIFTKGVGEWPLAMQATLSIWESAEAMEKFAYKHSGHREIVAKTRRENWYSEDMFARFAIEQMSGSYLGLHPKSDS
jgi:hypothetical protein